MDQNNNHKINKSLRFSFLDGAFASGMTGFTAEYFTPFLLLLGATAKHVGMLSALPNLFSSLVQLKSADFTERLKSRKKIINIFVFLQAIMLLPMAIIALLGGATPIIFILVVVLFAAFNAIATPAWASLISDLVSEDKRGAYFGLRCRILGFITVGATFIAGFILHKMKTFNAFYGFVIIFGFAFIFRIISWYFLMRMHEPALEYKKEHYFSLFDFLSRIRESNFAKFVIFASLMSFSVNLAAPFFPVFMLKDLRFSYLLYSLITITATLFVNLTIGRWGVHADRVGNIKIIRFTSRLIGIIPLLWIINHHPAFLFCVQIFSGFAWAGFNLCASNFIYDAVTPEKRTRCISYFNVFNGLGVCCGALIGGFLLPSLPAFLGYKILTLLLISAVLRIIVGNLIPFKLKEVKSVEKIKSTELFFSVVGIKPLLGIERQQAH